MRDYETCTAASMESFVIELTEIMAHDRTPVYRGQRDIDWGILPPLLREDLERTEFADWNQFEAVQMLKFKQRASGMLGCQPHSELEWKAQAAHRGLFNSLSAWSDSGLVALYFATEETPDEKDGVVWRLLPGDSSLEIGQDFEQVPDRAAIYRPRFLDPSMENQRVCFLAHPVPGIDTCPQPFEDHYRSGGERMHLCQIRIPHCEKRELRQKLALMAVDARSLFPGLSGVCGQIREEARSHSDAYEWVFEAA